MKRKMGKRIMSLALAAELFCAPLAIARAEDPAYEREELPLGEEIGAVQTTERELPVAQTPVEETAGEENAEEETAPAEETEVPRGGSAGAQLLEEVDWDYYYMGLSYGQEVSDGKVTRYDSYLKQESDDVDWGARADDLRKGSHNPTFTMDTDGGYVYFHLPDMGRLPDLTLEGLYFYGPAKDDVGASCPNWIDDVSTLMTWRYDEEHPENYRRLNYELVAEGDAPAGLRLTTTGTLARVLKTEIATAVDDGFAVGYPDEDNIYWDWYVPVVARWTDSADSDMTMFSADITGTYSGTVTTTPVSQFYTKPFRQAAADDRIDLAPYTSVTYPAQTPEEVADKTTHQETREEQVFYPASAKGTERHYYLRVDEEVESFTLRFQTQEPYYTYHVVDNSGSANKPVAVTATFPGKDANGNLETRTLPVELKEEWKGDGTAMFPTVLRFGGTRMAQNGVDIPARAQWTVADIPLTKVSEAYNTSADPFTTVKVTITAPDGTTTSTYVFHIERRMTPETALGYGNSPAAMILRDESSVWSKVVDWGEDAATTVDPSVDRVAYNKASALYYLKAHLTFADIPIKPNGASNQSGSIFMGDYGNLAWTGISALPGAPNNPDLDETAVMAYQDMAFDDPGVSFVDSEGLSVVFGDGASGDYVGCVKRTIELKTSSVLTADSYGGGTTCWYNVDAGGKPILTTDENQAAQTLRNADGTDGVDLRGLNVLPGIYSMVYTFTDPLGGDELRAYRRLVVLPIPGDVDMDGAVTPADALTLEEYAGTWTGSSSVYRLLRNRVYNMQLVHGISTITVDAEAIRQGFQPVRGDTEALGYSDYLYIPLPYTAPAGDTYHARKTWDEVTTLSASEAKLRLDFLGVEQGAWSHMKDENQARTGEVYTTNISGPWSSATQNDTKGVSIVAGDPDTGKGDVFWMGVYVEDPGDMKDRPIKDLSVSLIYDSEFVVPAELYYAHECGGSYENAASRWRTATLMRYNLLKTVPSGSNGAYETGGSVDGTGAAMTIFSGRTGNDYDLSHSTYGRSYTTHYSKVEGDLEQLHTNAYGRLESDKLKEVVFSIQAKSAGTMATMKEGYLLVLPFKLISHPSERIETDPSGKDTAQLVELAAGMRDFNVVLGPKATTAGMFSLFSASDSSETTYAFSAQDAIYGGATQNIRASLTYSGENSMVRIGEDNTIRTTLLVNNANPVYDQAFTITNLAFNGGTVTAGALPPGITLDGSLSQISGTPTKAGTYDFTIRGVPYRIIVEPKEIHYRAEAFSTYYGEVEFRGDNASRNTTSTGRDFTFVYCRKDLSSRDQTAAKALWSDWATVNTAGVEIWGSAEELQQILQRGEELAAGVRYIAPAFVSKDGNGVPVAQKSPVGKYAISLENTPLTTNYDLTFSTTGGMLTIERRPVWLDHLVVSKSASGARIYNDETGSHLSLTAEETSGGTPLLYLGYNTDVAIPAGENMWMIEGIPVTGTPRVAGDILGIRYSGSFVQTAADEAYVQTQIDEGKGQVAYRFLLSSNEETRQVAVDSISTSFLTTGAGANYNLHSNAILNRAQCQVTGTVVRRGVSAIRFTRYPDMLKLDDGVQMVPAYYGSVINDTELFVEVTRGTGNVGSPDVVVGEYVYNNPLLQPMEIHYNWVSPSERAAGLADPESIVGTGWDPTKPEDQQDLRPFNGTDILTPAIDGYYLCAAVRKYEADIGDETDEHYIKVYSDNPIHIEKKTITLEPVNKVRYYGEQNGELSYTYNIKDLLPVDEAILEAWAAANAEAAGEEDTEPKLTGQELEAFFRQKLGDTNFVAPTLVTSKTASVPQTAADQVTAGTPVGGGQFYIILQGGFATNYDFAYTRPRSDGGRGTETVSGAGAYGVSQLTVLRRPIQVQNVYSPQGTKENFETIYADTKNLYLTNQTASGSRVEFSLPQTDTVAGTTSFYRHGSNGRIVQSLTYADPDTTVLAGDDVSLSYSVRFMVEDNNHWRWLGFDNNYYDIAALSAAGGTLQKDVVVADLDLTGADASNYELVFNNADTAYCKAPVNSQEKYYADPNNNGRVTFYLVHGTGAVTLRRIETLSLQSVGRVSYIYGDTYAPYTNNATTQTPMVALVEYETAEDVRHNNGDYENNVHAETVTFRVTNATDAITTFGQRGFTIYYLKDGQTTEQARAAGQVLTYSSEMIPGEHHNARLFITGKRRAEDATITSVVSSSRLQVSMRELTFSVRDAHRYYGETLHVNEGDVLTDDYLGSTGYTYTFPMSQLAQRDRDRLAQLKGLEADMLDEEGTEADLKLLQTGASASQAGLLAASGWDLGLTDPSYSGDPGRTGTVNQSEWGEYPIAITTHDMSNYKVTGEPGTLYVYPRPVKVTGILSDQEDPIYTIYNQSSHDTFTTQIDTQRAVMTRNNLSVTGSGLVIDPKVSSRYCSDGIIRAMPLSGEAMVGEDSLIFTVRLWFYTEGDSTWDLTAGVADYAKKQVQVTFRSVSATETAQNYTVANVSAAGASSGTNFVLNGVWGAVKLRTIDEIFITRKPKTAYTYGDTLDLSGLEVTIRYKALQGQGESVPVGYLGPDQFLSYGLYVNYWYPEDTIPGGRKPNSNDAGEKDATTSTTAEDALRKALPNTYRRADWGDHLTIAPTHDTQQYIGVTSSDPKRRPFAANGKYLIISAFQEGDQQMPTAPKVLGEAVTTSVGTSYESESQPIAIQITPKQLRYDLSAQDKTYDGTTQAAGTLTLQNVYDAQSQVQIEEIRTPGDDGNGDDIEIQINNAVITDVVYIPMGADYENHGDDYANAGYNSYRGKIHSGQVAFTTGTYRANGEAPLEGNGQIDWAQGYTWGQGLTFTFANPNVHYLEPGETDSRVIGTEDLAAYWRRSQSHNTTDSQWDSYGQVCAMPVEVTNMILAGPDAANYTWATDGTLDTDVDVTMTTRAQSVAGQAAAPYATIHKANRSTIQTLAGTGLTLPYLQVDEHTNVVRLFYSQALSALADNNNAADAGDEFRDELHFEYALYYQDDAGLLTQWAGKEGNKSYQDTCFFGGELVTPEPAVGYLPDYERLPDPEKNGDDMIPKGQHYQWAEEDTGVSELGCREDGGIEVDRDAYPGGAAGADAYTWYYDLYTWGEGGSRTPLPRDTVFYPMVRLSETHNYNPSGCLTGSTDVTAQVLDTAQKALAARASGTGEDAAVEASGAVFSAAASMTRAAMELSQARKDYDAALAEMNKLPEEGRPLIGSAPAVKTFLQRLDLISVEQTRSADREDDTDYIIRTLEDVWFTDTTRYLEMKNLDAVVYNEGSRYYNYYWDEDMTTALQFNGDFVIDFDTEMAFTIRVKTPTGWEDTLWTYSPVASNHTAPLYVQVNRTGGSLVRTLQILPSVLYARLGDAPYQLTVKSVPALPTNRSYVWTSSDPSVATVSATGLVTFRGIGSAVITVSANNGRSASISVFVSSLAPIEPETGEAPLFNFDFQGPWEVLDENGAFRPHDEMTRAELVILLDKFLNPASQWRATQEMAYIDVTGREKYYEALRRLTAVGVVKGIPGSAFAGDQLATRAEFATMLARMLQLNVKDTKGMVHAFADSGEGDTWAYAYVDALAKTGVLRGVGGGNFAPGRNITREETAAIIARLLTAQIDMDQSDLARPTDMTPENWSYESVVRAVNTIAFPT